MIFHETTLKDAKLIELEPHGDERGFFARTMCKKEFAQHGLLADFSQINMSFSAHKGTLRGMHFQRGADSEAKLIRCTKGAVLDVIVDLRGQSPTYLKHEAFELTEDNRRQLYVPPGFAHAFLTLTDNVEVVYPVTMPYAPKSEGGVRYDDPLLAISWPIPITTVSQKDLSWSFLVEGAPAIF